MNKRTNIYIIAIMLTSLFMNGCGYKLGLVGTDQSVRHVYCYTVRNESRRPGLEMPATNSIIREIQKRGDRLTVVSSPDQADTFLVVTITTVTSSASRLDDSDFLEESKVDLNAQMALYRTEISYDEDTFELIEHEAPFFESSISVASTFFIEPNQPEGEYSIIPQIMEKLGREIVYKILDRWNVPE